MRRASEIQFGIKYELGSNKSTILLAGSDSSPKQNAQLSFSRFTRLPMPSGIVWSGSVMVHNKHKMINNIKHDFTFWQGLELVSTRPSVEVKACKRCAIPNAFGDCDVSETERQIKTAHGLGMHLQQCVRKLILLSGSFTSSLQELTSRVISAVQLPRPSGIAKRQKRNNRCIAHTFRERLHVAA